MFDIKFYEKVFDLKARLMRLEPFSKEMLFSKLEEYRSKSPVIYNIETTNACNMKCVMCPRTTMMTRPVETMGMDVFQRIIEQIEPFRDDDWREWEYFCEKKYGITKNDMSENHFFLYIIPKVLVLHGYGDPLLDPKMPERVGLLESRDIPSYFSCNPANISIKKTAEIFRKGLDYIKFSIESVDDATHKNIRGSASDFTSSYGKIRELLDIKKKENLKTTIVITMLDLNSPRQNEEFLKLEKAFKGLDVYIYFKSQDQKWYMGGDRQTRSLHWAEFCQFPWSSLTVKSNGEVAMCVEDFNNEIILGDAKTESLSRIWNGNRYTEFRKYHFNMNKDMKCTKKCDMKLIGNMNLIGDLL